MLVGFVPHTGDPAMPRRRITCEADLDFPMPNSQRAVAMVRALSNGKRPVTATAVARAFGVDWTLAIEAVLRRAERNGLVRRLPDRTWVATDYA
jgi:hypothetical protein